MKLVKNFNSFISEQVGDMVVYYGGDLELYFNALLDKGIKAVRFIDSNLITLKEDIKNILVLDNAILKINK